MVEEGLHIHGREGHCSIMGGSGRTAVSIMYHDVLDDGRTEASGLTGPGAGLYKLGESEFRAQLEAIRNAIGTRSVGLVEHSGNELLPLLLTFDDGGASAYTRIAGALERYGWRGHFFVPTDYIGRPGFLTAAQIRELHRRGHLIGSHSCSHPPRISHCPGNELLRQWTASVTVLAEILNAPVTTASVPGGFYTPRVAQAAAQAGIRVLFNSEPTTSVCELEGCLVFGRYSIRRGMRPADVAAFASGARLARTRQAVAWHLRRAAKASGGGLYFAVREYLLALRKPG